MKTSAYLTIIALFYCITSCAQTKFTPGIIRGKQETFEVILAQPTATQKRYIFVHPKKNRYDAGIPRPKDNYQFRILKTDIHIDLAKINDIIYEALKNKRQALHDSNESIQLYITFETDGTLTDNSFTLLKDTRITPAEIEQIDHELRKNIKATFTGIDYTHYAAVHYNINDIKF